ncbi:MAG: DUF115 domain-containing protein [Treponema sp.]|jgi:hypothetical protein|nr:DUF115 domain-containing protein [Treponema sp.]
MNDEMPRRLPARRGFSVSYRGKTLLSLIDPSGQADRAADTAPVLNRTLYFCPSPLYGYGLARLLERIGAGSAVLCVEADERLMALTLETMPAEMREDRRLRLVRTSDAAALCRFVRNCWGSRRFRRLETLRLSGGWQLAPELYGNLAAALRREMAVEWGNAMTLVKLGRRYIRNALRNLALTGSGGGPAAGIEDLDYGGQPVLVLGAGPSLDAALEGCAVRFAERLDPFRRPFKIICVDTALTSLKARNIEPDLAVALESQHWNLRDFIGLGSRKIPVAMDLSALPATAGFSGGLFLFVTPWTELRLFDRLRAAGMLPEPLSPLGSVGLTAVELARRLTRGSVILAGIDFSFTLDASHARSSPGHLALLAAQNRFRSLISGAAFSSGAAAAAAKSGVLVRSNPAMRNYRSLFEQEFAADPRLRDIAGPGLPLGLKTLSMEEALDALDTAPAGNVPAGSVHADGLHADGEPGSVLAESEGSARTGTAGSSGKKPERNSKLAAFMQKERAALVLLRDILSGAAGPDTVSGEELETMLDEADYLWAHFPECAGAGGRRPAAADLSFLKRVRIELDPFIRLWDLVLKEWFSAVE